MAAIRMAVINEATHVTDAEAEKFTAALQAQIHEDFLPVWGIDCSLGFVPKGEKLLDPSVWWLVLLDNADMAGALGYHDFTASGLPIGKVFVETTKRYGGIWTVTGSHEALEILADPDISICVLAANKDFPKGALYARENCDAVEADELGYEKLGVMLSDFQTPAWFEAPRRAQVDFCNHIKKPFQLAPGGYISVLDLAHLHRGWQQLTARSDRRNFRARAPIGSRRERRRLPREQWHRSVVSTRGATGD